MPLPPIAPPAPAEAPLDPAIVQRAAEWMARLWSEGATEEDKSACARWRAAHPDHELAWRCLQHFEDKLDSVPREAARLTLEETIAKSAARRRALRLLGVLTAIGAAVQVARRSDAWQSATADERSGTGEIREFMLPDGSRVTLASASAIDLRFDESERLLVLRAGEIMVSTATDPAPVARPFRVRSRQGTIQALGTRFAVREDGNLTRVAVLEGAVEVRPALDQAQAVRIVAGRRASFSNAQVENQESLRENDAGWVRGVLVASDMPLGDVIRELDRYRPGVLRCDPTIAGMGVTGVFSLRDTDRALRSLESVLPIAIVYRSRYWVTVQAR